MFTFVKTSRRVFVAARLLAYTFLLSLGHTAVLADTACTVPMKLAIKDSYVYMTGGICEGDSDKFIQFMQGKGQPYKVLRLNNMGGLGLDAIKMGRYLRANKLTTWTDGKQDVCSSGCNRVFAGGLKRVYSRADNIMTGKNVSSRRGLGYHLPNANGARDSQDMFYEQNIIPYLKEMLPAAAVAWIVKTDEGNPTENMVWLNGNRAIRLGIATDSQSPF